MTGVLEHQAVDDVDDKALHPDGGQGLAVLVEHEDFAGDIEGKGPGWLS